MQNLSKQNYREKGNKLGTDPPIGIGTNDINAYILFVYFCILKQGRKRTYRKMKREMMFLNCENKNKIIISSQTRVQMVGAYFDLESGGVRRDQIKILKYRNSKNFQ